MDLQRIRLVQNLLLWCGVIILTFKSAKSVMATPIHRICHPTILNSAFQCAYVAYLPLLSEETGLEHLKQFYLRMLPEEVEGKNYSCEDKNFMESTGDVSISKIDEYFHSAMEHCISTDLNYRDHAEPLKTEVTTPSLGQFLLAVRSRHLGISCRLSHFCILMMRNRGGVNRANALRHCCPSLRRRPTGRKYKEPTRCCPRLSHTEPEAEGSPPRPVCHKETLHSASECACKVYKEESSKRSVWITLDDICDEKFGNVTLSTSLSCTTFMKLQNPGVPFNESQLYDYIDEACETCSSFHFTKNFKCLHKIENDEPRLQREFAAEKYIKFCLLQAARFRFSVHDCFKNKRLLIDLQHSLKKNESDEDIKPDLRQSLRTLFHHVNNTALYNSKADGEVHELRL